MKSGNVRRCPPIGTPIGTRFWSKVDKSGDCWTWTAAINPSGYGVFTGDGRSMNAHRWAWTLEYGEVPSGLVVCHWCDNPACVRPEHLFVATQRMNVWDMDRKGRRGDTSHHGESHPRAKLTDADVAAIRSSSESAGTLAHRYGIHPAYVYALRNGSRRSAA